MVTLPFTDAKIIITMTSGIIAVDATQFYLTFGSGFMKLVSCSTISYGMCSGTEPDPSSIINNYLSSDQYWINNLCVSCPDGWRGLNGKCFRKFQSVNATIDYAASLAGCQSNNSSLAILNTEAKYNLVLSMIEDQHAGFVNIIFFNFKLKNIN